jgi:hypothetical protein
MFCAKYSVRLRIVALLLCCLFLSVDLAMSQQTITQTNLLKSSNKTFPTILSSEYADISEYINTNKKYPLKPLLYGKKSGEVTISYVITASGKIKNQRILKSTDKSYSKEVFRLLNEVTDWSPASLDDKNVSVKCTLKVEFDAPLESDLNLRNAIVIYNGIQLPKNKIWYMADHIYLDQLIILDNKQSQALFGRPLSNSTTIIINTKENVGSSTKPIYSKLKNIDSNYYSLYIDDKKVNIDSWKQALVSEDIKNLIIEKDSSLDQKLRARLATSRTILK